MADWHYYLALALTALLATALLLVRLARAVAAPWRALAEAYPGPSPPCTTEVSYVIARFRGRSRPLSFTRCIRLRGCGRFLVLSVVGLDYTIVKLREIVIPRGAIADCAECDFVVPRQRVALVNKEVCIVLYGRGAKFVRTWWQEGAAGGDK